MSDKESTVIASNDNQSNKSIPDLARSIKEIFIEYPENTKEGYEERRKALYNYLVDRFSAWYTDVPYLVCVDKEFDSCMKICDNLLSAINYMVTDYLQYWQEDSVEDSILYLVPYSSGIEISHKDVMLSEDE